LLLIGVGLEQGLLETLVAAEPDALALDEIVTLVSLGQ